jgi:hypothetical protein
MVQGHNDSRCALRPMRVHEQKLKALGKTIDVQRGDFGHKTRSQAQQIEH